MWDKLIDLDTRLFLLINGSHSPFFDLLMLWLSKIYPWIPLYIFIIFIIWRAFPQKKALYGILYILLAAGIADFITSGLMKPYFARLRPCHDPTLAQVVQLVGNCGGTFGFASSHAANTFALFGGLFFLFPNRKKIVNPIGLWAILVSYSRIYLGVHYPTDVLVGACIGFLTSFLLFRLLLTPLITKTSA